MLALPFVTLWSYIWHTIPHAPNYSGILTSNTMTHHGVFIYFFFVLFLGEVRYGLTIQPLTRLELAM